jgi:hypothetical protein
LSASLCLSFKSSYIQNETQFSCWKRVFTNKINKRNIHAFDLSRSVTGVQLMQPVTHTVTN